MIKKINEIINCKFKNTLELFLIDNYDSIELKGYNNLKLNFYQNIFEFEYLDLNIEYDLKSLESNIFNNCCEDITIYNSKYNITDRKIDQILNSDLFEELEKVAYNVISEIENLLLQFISEFEYDMVTRDDIKSAYDIFSSEVI